MKIAPNKLSKKMFNIKVQLLNSNDFNKYKEKKTTSSYSNKTIRKSLCLVLFQRFEKNIFQILTQKKFQILKSAMSVSLSSKKQVKIWSKQSKWIKIWTRRSKLLNVKQKST